MVARQLVFDLPLRAAMVREDFLVTPANAQAVTAIDAWHDWPFAKMVLTGPEGAGKTHLAHVWAAQAGARIINAVAITPVDMDAPALVVEDADRIAGNRGAETALFHLHNALAHRGAHLLLTARDAPQRWGLCLPDLDSRMGQAGVLRLPPPDDTLLMALMIKLAADRQIPLTPAIVQYAAPRLERAAAAVQQFIAALDAAALAEKTPPRLRHAKAVLAQTPR
jgi:chromosomal replication initiation ATPase DnaA